MSLLDARNVSVDLPTTARWIRPVNDLSFQLAPAESLGLVGESGSGKTMLALSLMGLLPPGARITGTAVLQRAGPSGSCLAGLNEKEWRNVRGREIAVIFQEPMTSLNRVMRIGVPALQKVHRLGASGTVDAILVESDIAPSWGAAVLHPCLCLVKFIWCFGVMRGRRQQ